MVVVFPTRNHVALLSGIHLNLHRSLIQGHLGNSRDIVRRWIAWLLIYSDYDSSFLAIPCRIGSDSRKLQTIILEDFLRSIATT